MNEYYINGPAYGVVTSNEDPENLGRVKVMVSVMGDTIETDWIPMLSLYASSDSGALFIPEVDDIVVVAFVGDNPERGIVLGAIWNEDNLPPETGENTAADLNKDGENSLHFIKSKSGHMIILDDTNGDEKLQIIAADGNTRLEFLTQNKVLSVKTDMDFIITADGALNITAKECKVKLDNGLKIEANAISFESTGADVKIKASSDVTLEGGSIKLN